MLTIISMFICTLFIVLSIASFASGSIFTLLFTPLHDSLPSALSVLIPLIWCLIIIIIVLSLIEFWRRWSEKTANKERRIEE